MTTNQEKAIKVREDIKKALTVAKYMLQGALGLIAIIAIVWSINNMDVIAKAVKYPEAVREMEITVQVTKTQLISPIAK